MSSTGKLLTGIVAGAAAGAVLGILFAPDKGTETRKKIAQKGTDLSESVKTRISKVGEAITNKYDAVKNDANNVVDNGREAASRMQHS